MFGKRARGSKISKTSETLFLCPSPSLSLLLFRSIFIFSVFFFCLPFFAVSGRYNDVEGYETALEHRLRLCMCARLIMMNNAKKKRLEPFNSHIIIYIRCIRYSHTILWPISMVHLEVVVRQVNHGRESRNDGAF